MLEPYEDEDTGKWYFDWKDVAEGPFDSEEACRRAIDDFIDMLESEDDY